MRVDPMLSLLDERSLSAQLSRRFFLQKKPALARRLWVDRFWLLERESCSELARERPRQ
jgi:hypothetical protein